MRQTLFTPNANKTSHSNSGRRHTMSSRERGEKISLWSIPRFSWNCRLYSHSKGCLWIQSKDTIIWSNGQCDKWILRRKILLNLWEKDFLPYSLTFIKFYWLHKCDIKLCPFVLLKEGMREAGNMIDSLKHAKTHNIFPPTLTTGIEKEV